MSASGKARGFRNFPGVDVIPLDSLGTEHLAPGGVPGRLTIYTPASLEKIRGRFPKTGISSLPARSPSTTTSPTPAPTPKGGAA